MPKPNYYLASGGAVITTAMFVASIDSSTMQTRGGAKIGPHYAGSVHITVMPVEILSERRLLVQLSASIHVI